MASIPPTSPRARGEPAGGGRRPPPAAEPPDGARDVLAAPSGRPTAARDGAAAGPAPRAPQAGPRPAAVPAPVATLEGERVLLAGLAARLRAFQAATRYDRLVYLEAALNATAAAPHAAALADAWRGPAVPAWLDSGSLAAAHGAGHCAGLASLFVAQLADPHAYVAPAHLAAEMQGRDFPQPAHAAVVVPLPGGAPAFILMDVGLGMPRPVVVRAGVPDTLDVGDERRLYTLGQGPDGAPEILCQPLPPLGEPPWKRSKLVRKAMRYETVPFADIDARLTLPLLRVDRRLPVLARDARGVETVAFVLNLGKQRLEQRVGGRALPPLSFAEVHARLASGAGVIDPAVAGGLGVETAALDRRIGAVVRRADSLPG